MDALLPLISAEHSALRASLADLVRTCRDALHDEKLRPAVVRKLRDVISAIQEHLAYEEQALFPLLRTSDAWGPVRVEALGQEHEAQRQTLVALGEDAADGTRPLREIVDEIVWFVRNFERDMEREESGLSERDEVVVIDQVDG
jgi:iron-sulfur cluster repair protein YtfE (RIC family)